ncbi:DUF885 domain-containing protein [Flavisolibacter nicotianae]|uniref:DUF885 domain-containing protein n=1 Tax=Flavisolibacter nicotianae TaxID=2364882 RepID=UPI0013C4312A|nr:DUF885 domain-containing protein [Flavisolibacter nicotianae]
MRKLLLLSALLAFLAVQAQNNQIDKRFDDFKVQLLDACWKRYPEYAIYFGYGKYYDKPAIPNEQYFKGNLTFFRQWIDSLHKVPFQKLSANNQVSYRIIENQLRLFEWQIGTLKIHQWNPASYNIGNQCYLLYTQNYAPLEKKLETLSAFLQFAGQYYKAALNTLDRPTKEHTLAAISQNEGALTVFGKALTDSINDSHLSPVQKDTLQRRIDGAQTAIKEYIAALKSMASDSNYSFRSFRIGADLFNQKFQREIVTDYTAKEIFDKAIVAKNEYHQDMFKLANQLWPKYGNGLVKPTDSLLLIKAVIDKISLHHVAQANVFDTLNSQLKAMKRFIVQKDLFDFDTLAPIIVRKKPAFSSSVAMASADFPSPYLKSTAAYYNIADISAMPPAKAESMLRENNNYMLQILTIHEGVPGHCLQGVYNTKSPDIIKSVFRNGPMAEGWAVYSERMMLENGWGNDSPEMQLMYDKWRLRVACNVIVDYGLHCLNYSKDDVIKLLRNEAFQEEAELEEKYQRATLSEVQLCYYFTGATEILTLREDYKKKMGAKYRLKDFHERFLSYGTAPVKFIRERMLSKAL